MEVQPLDLHVTESTDHNQWDAINSIKTTDTQLNSKITAEVYVDNAIKKDVAALKT